MIVGQVEIRRSGRTRVDLKGQGIPAALICELEIGAHRQYGAGADEKGQGLEPGIVPDPARAIETSVAPEVIPAALREIDIARAHRREHWRDKQVGPQEIFIVHVSGRRI